MVISPWVTLILLSRIDWQSCNKMSSLILLIIFDGETKEEEGGIVDNTQRNKMLTVAMQLIIWFVGAIVNTIFASN